MDLSAEATTILTQKQRHEFEHERECWCGYKFGNKYEYRRECKCGRGGKSRYLSTRSDVVHQLRQGRSDGSVMLLKCLAHTLQGIPLLIIIIIIIMIIITTVLLLYY